MEYVHLVQIHLVNGLVIVYRKQIIMKARIAFEQRNNQAPVLSCSGTGGTPKDTANGAFYKLKDAHILHESVARIMWSGTRGRVGIVSFSDHIGYAFDARKQLFIHCQRRHI
eukprot:949728_1